jgi:hypothetical protein
MTLPQPSAFLSLVKGFDGECPCCRRLDVPAAVGGWCVGDFGREGRIGPTKPFVRPKVAAWLVAVPDVEMGSFTCLTAATVSGAAMSRRTRRRVQCNSISRQENGSAHLRVITIAVTSASGSYHCLRGQRLRRQ